MRELSPGESMLERYLRQLAEELEMSEIPAIDEATKTFSLEILETMPITLEQKEPGVSLFAKLSPPPELKREDLFLHLMKANFLGQGTGGSAIGLQDDEKFLTLSSLLPYDMDYAAFKRELEDFVNYVVYWKNTLCPAT